jgi:hypothetical protein
MSDDDITDRPPPVFRHFLYLDEEEVLNALSGVQGGAVEEAVDEIVRSGERNLGVSIAIGGQGLSLGTKSAKQMKRDIRRRQTVHAAVAALVHALNDQIMKLPRPTEVKIEENSLVLFHCDLCYCQSRAVREAYEKEREALASRNWIERLFDRREQHEKRDRDRAAGIGEAFVALAFPADHPQPRFVIWLDSQYLVVPLAEFSRRATVVGQVVGTPRSGEQVVLEGHDFGTTARLVPVHEEPPYRRHLHGGGVRLRISELDWSIEPDQDALAEALLLRPLFIFK